MAHVVVIGAGLGGLPTAYELRQLLPSQHRVTLISDQPKFTFIPGMGRVGLNIDPLDHFQLDLEPLAQRHNIELVKRKVIDLDPHTQRITLENGEVIDYDYVAIATGPSFAFDAIPGLGPHDGYTHSICSPSHALEARDAWLQFLENPGSLVVGAAPGTGCLGPAYEFILMAEQILRQKGRRDRATLTLVTPEPYAGHLGVSGVKNAQKLTAALLRKRGIEVIANVAITAISRDTVTLDNGRTLPQQYAMILPAFRGASFIQNTPGLGNEKGFYSGVVYLPASRLSLGLCPRCRRQSLSTRTIPRADWPAQKRTNDRSHGHGRFPQYCRAAWSSAKAAANRDPGGHLLCRIWRHWHSLCGSSGTARPGYRPTALLLRSAREMGGLGQCSVRAILYDQNATRHRRSLVRTTGTADDVWRRSGQTDRSRFPSGSRQCLDPEKYLGDNR